MALVLLKPPCHALPSLDHKSYLQELAKCSLIEDVTNTVLASCQQELTMNLVCGRAELFSTTQHVTYMDKLLPASISK